jgi:hypothetical protein
VPEGQTSNGVRPRHEGSTWKPFNVPTKAGSTVGLGVAVDLGRAVAVGVTLGAESAGFESFPELRARSTAEATAMAITTAEPPASSGVPHADQRNTF